MFDRTAFEDQEVAVTIPLPSRRSRRLSMPSTMPSSLRRRSRLPTPSPSDGERTVSDKAMPHIPFASPPYMPIFGASSSSSSLVSSPPSRTKADVRRSMPISLHSASATPSTPSQTSSRPRHLRTESSRFRRRLARWTSSSSRDELDFGCAGNNSNSNWLEGPQDLVSRDGCELSWRARTILTLACILAGRYVLQPVPGYGEARLDFLCGNSHWRVDARTRRVDFVDALDRFDRGIVHAKLARPPSVQQASPVSVGRIRASYFFGEVVDARFSA